MCQICITATLSWGTSQTNASASCHRPTQANERLLLPQIHLLFLEVGNRTHCTRFSHRRDCTYHPASGLLTPSSSVRPQLVAVRVLHFKPVRPDQWLQPCLTGSHPLLSFCTMLPSLSSWTGLFLDCTTYFIRPSSVSAVLVSSPHPSNTQPATPSSRPVGNLGPGDVDHRLVLLPPERDIRCVLHRP